MRTGRLEPICTWECLRNVGHKALAEAAGKQKGLMQSFLPVAGGIGLDKLPDTLKGCPPEPSLKHLLQVSGTTGELLSLQSNISIDEQGLVWSFKVTLKVSSISQIKGATRWKEGWIVLGPGEKLSGCWTWDHLTCKELSILGFYVQSRSKTIVASLGWGQVPRKEAPS